MITHKVTVLHTVTYEAILNVSEADPRVALRTAEAAMIQNPELGRVINREIKVTDIDVVIAPDPATPATR